VADVTDNNKLTHLLDDAIPGGGIMADWSPDGRKLCVTISDGSMRLYEADRWEGPIMFYMDFVGLRSSRPSWSPDSQQFAISTIHETTYIWLCMLNGQCEPLLNEISENWKFPESAGEVIWSPDGKRILYIVFSGSLSQSQKSQIWTIDVETHDRQMMLETDKLIDNPRWSPDGEKIAFLDWNNRNVYQYDIDTGKLKTVLGEGLKDYLFEKGKYDNIGGVWWSPDSRYLAFSSTYSISILDLSDADVKTMATGDFNIIRWTSDGKSLLVGDRYGSIFYIATQ
jgi:Tol biopolymer transport system component